MREEDIAVSFDGVHQRRPVSGGNVPAAGGGGRGPAGLPFMSFDYGPAAHVPPPTIGGGYGAGSSGGGGGFGAFEEDAPLLDELGINFTQISRKMLTVVNPFRRVMHLHEDADLAGPFIFCILFGVCQLLAGKLHFGVILGWTSLASLYVYMVLNLLVGRYGSLDLYHCGSLVGYSLLPMVIFSLLSIFVPGRGVLEFILAVLTVIWCTRSCTTLMIDLVPNAEEYRSLIAYPCGLIYTAFCLLVVF